MRIEISVEGRATTTHVSEIRDLTKVDEETYALSVGGASATANVGEVMRALENNRLRPEQLEPGLLRVLQGILAFTQFSGQFPMPLSMPLNQAPDFLPAQIQRGSCSPA